MGSIRALQVARDWLVGTCFILQKSTGSYLIAKTKNNNDDANFDDVSTYKYDVRKLIESAGIKYVIDLHGLGAHHDCELNLGTHLGNNIKSDIKNFDLLCDLLAEHRFSFRVEQPFMAG